MSWAVFWALLPIAFLVVVMTKPRPWPSTVAFAAGAILAFGIGVAWFGHPLPLLGAAVVAGLLEALTPISIVFGAILFFRAMERSGFLETLQVWLRGVSPHPVAQVQIVGFAFLFLIEGAAGFGTPAALAAPMLVALGFPALPVAVVCLVFNGVCTIFGAVGTPVWFGLGPLNFTSEELLAIGAQSALFQVVAGWIVPVVALRFLFPWFVIGRNLVFIWLSILSCTVPMWIVAQFSYEFPIIAGGLVGLPLTILMARWGVGLAKCPALTECPALAKCPAEAPTGDTAQKTGKKSGIWQPGLLLAATPLLVTVGVLLVTRIPAFGLRAWLTSTQPLWTLPLGTDGGMGELRLSEVLVLQWQDILGQGLQWTYQTLYVPAWIPFALTAFLALWLGRARGATRSVLWTTIAETVHRVRTPVLALAGALVLVKLLMAGGDRSATLVLGEAFAGAAGDSWKYFAPLLGALGSFFSGSTTISNLTFGGIQMSIAEATGLPISLVLALQLSGASMGNMICIHNIVAVCAVLLLVNQEGAILRKTAGPCALFAVILAMLVALLPG